MGQRHRHVLIVANKPASAWIDAVSRTLAQIGEIHLVAEQDVAAVLGSCCYDLALVDTSALEQDAADLVRRLVACQDDLPVVVVTTSPTWQRARAVFLAGATDYVRRTFEEQKLRDMCQSAIFRRKGVVQTHDSPCG